MACDNGTCITLCLKKLAEWKDNVDCAYIKQV